MKKIFIFGISGAGKSYLASKLSKKLKVSHFDLDDTFFEIKYSKRRDPEEIKKLLKKITRKKSWIIEGVYTSLTQEVMKNAEKIIWVQSPKNLTSFRILKRWIKRKKESKETFNDLFGLLRFQRSYKKIRKGKSESYYKKHLNVFHKFNSKTLIIKNNKELIEFIDSLE